MKRRIATAMLLCILLLLAGCGVSEGSEETTAQYGDIVVYANRVNHVTIDWDSDYAGADYESDVSYSSYVVDAKFLGFYPEKRWNRALFQVTSVHKGPGELKDRIIDVNDIYGFVADENNQIYERQQVPYIVGHEYMLLLNDEQTDVYSQQGRYTQRYLFIQRDREKNWKEVHDRAAKVIARTDKSAPFVKNYTLSTQIDESLDYTHSIFYVSVDYVFKRYDYEAYTDYLCTVQKTVRGQPVHNGKIVIRFFDDTVEVGQQYLTLLADPGNSFRYTLASPNSVFTWEEAKQIPELASLLENAEDYMAAK